MQKKTGIHFYIDKVRLDNVSGAEEKAANEVRHIVCKTKLIFSFKNGRLLTKTHKQNHGKMKLLKSNVFKGICYG